MTSLEKLAEGFGFVENRSKSLSLLDKAAAGRPRSVYTPAAGGNPAYFGPPGTMRPVTAAQEDVWKRNPKFYPTNHPLYVAPRPPGGGPAPRPPGGGAPPPPPGGGGAPPPPPGGGAAAPPFNPFPAPPPAALPPGQKYGRPAYAPTGQTAHPGISAMPATHLPWRRAPQFNMPAGWKPEDDPYYKKYFPEYRQLTADVDERGVPVRGSGPRSNQQLYRDMIMNRGVIRRAINQASGGPTMDTGDVFKPYTQADYLAARDFRYPSEKLRTSISAAFPYGVDASGAGFPDKPSYEAAYNAAKSQGELNRQAQRVLTQKMAPHWAANKKYAIPRGYSLRQVHRRLGVNP